MNHNVIRLPRVIEKTGKPRSSIYWMIEQEIFPKQIKLGARSVGWLESEVDEWIEKRIYQSRMISSEGR